MITGFCLNTTFDRFITVPQLQIGVRNNATADTTHPGGKAINAARIAQALGAEARAVALAGGPRGQKLREELERLGIPVDVVEIAGETRQTLNITDASTGERTMIAGLGYAVMPDELARGMAKLRETISAGDIVILAGSLPRQCPPEIYRDAVALAHECDALPFLDAVGEQLTLALDTPRMPWMVKPNRRELALWLGIERRAVDVERAAQGARELVRRGVRLAVITLDSEGAVAAWGSESVYLPALPVEVISTTGAGDAFVGGIAAAVARGDDLREAVRLGMAASAASVTRLGAGRVDPDEVARLLPDVRMEDIS